MGARGDGYDKLHELDYDEIMRTGQVSGERERGLDQMLADWLRLEPFSSEETQPLSVIEKLEKTGIDEATYERLIPVVEAECLRLIPLLEQYQLLMRGDTYLEQYRIADSKITHPFNTSFVRNRPLEFSQESDKLRILSALLTEILMRSMNRGKPGTTAAIIFGANPFRVEFREGHAFLNPEYLGFFGHTDDIGEYAEKAYVLDVSTKQESRELFPPGQLPGRLDLVLSEAEKNRVKRVMDDEVFQQSRYSLHFWAYMSNHVSYFHALLYTYQMLRTIELQGKGNR